MEKQFNVMCMGRMTVDLYSQQINTCLEGMSSFTRYLGSSPGNVAYGTAHQGLRSSMLARVSDEHMGRFLREGLNQIDCDTSHLITDRDRLTVLVLLGIKSRDIFPLIFYRDNCADMAITTNDVDGQYITPVRCLATIGTHLSHPQTCETVLTALVYTRRHGVRTALDIDYCSVLWGLTSLGDGETRFIAANQVTHQLQEVLHLFDVVIGTEKEFHIAGDSTDMLQVLSQIRGVSHATLVYKRGVFDCSVYTDAISVRPDDDLTATGMRVEMLNVPGAGDAFMSGLLCGYLSDEGWEQARRYANACGMLVMSHHGRVPAVPSKVESDDYLSRAAEAPRLNFDPHLNRLYRMTTHRRTWSKLYVIALDYRNQLKDMVLQCGVSLKCIPVLEQLILQANHEAANSTGLEGKAGLLCDDTFNQDALNAVTREGQWISRSIELPGSRPLEVGHGDIGSQLIGWPQGYVVRRLIFFHLEDAHTLRLEQEQEVIEVYRACCQFGHGLLPEVILPISMPRSDELYLRAISRFCNLEIYPDWRRLPPLTSTGWMVLSGIIERRDPRCRGAVILGLDAPTEQLCVDSKVAAGHGVMKGFAVGRTLFGDASRA